MATGLLVTASPVGLKDGCLGFEYKTQVMRTFPQSLSSITIAEIPNLKSNISHIIDELFDFQPPTV